MRIKLAILSAVLSFGVIFGASADIFPRISTLLQIKDAIRQIVNYNHGEIVIEQTDAYSTYPAKIKLASDELDIIIKRQIDQYNARKAALQICQGLLENYVGGEIEGCPAGSYCHIIPPTEEDEEPEIISFACPAGYYCPRGTGEPVQCNPGTYCVGEKNYMAMRCPGGYYCPDGSSMLDCGVGNYCPPGASEPLSPEPGYLALTKNEAVQTRCPDGFYCPTSTTQIVCTPGNYCPGAVAAPKACTNPNACPVQSDRDGTCTINTSLTAWSIPINTGYNASTPVTYTSVAPCWGRSIDQAFSVTFNNGTSGDYCYGAKGSAYTGCGAGTGTSASNAARILLYRNHSSGSTQNVGPTTTTAPNSFQLLDYPVVALLRMYTNHGTTYKADIYRWVYLHTGVRYYITVSSGYFCINGDNMSNCSTNNFWPTWVGELFLYKLLNNRFQIRVWTSATAYADRTL